MKSHSSNKSTTTGFSPQLFLILLTFTYPGQVMAIDDICDTDLSGIQHSSKSFALDDQLLTEFEQQKLTAIQKAINEKALISFEQYGVVGVYRGHFSDLLVSEVKQNPGFKPYQDIEVRFSDLDQGTTKLLNLKRIGTEISFHQTDAKVRLDLLNDFEQQKLTAIQKAINEKALISFEQYGVVGVYRGHFSDLLVSEVKQNPGFKPYQDIEVRFSDLDQGTTKLLNLKRIGTEISFK